jgi:uridine kinase
MKSKSFIVGVCGASSSGKTTFLKDLCGFFNETDVCMLSLDNYYKPKNELHEDENGVINFDEPTCLNKELYLKDIKSLMHGHEVQIKEYTFNNPDKEPTIITLKPSPILIIEGLFIYYYQELKKIFDLKVFLDVEDHIRLKRRMERDRNERGYDLEDVLYRYEHHVFPAYKRYISPYKYEADMIIPNNKSYEKGLHILVSFLKNKLS